MPLETYRFGLSGLNGCAHCLHLPSIRSTGRRWSNCHPILIAALLFRNAGGSDLEPLSAVYGSLTGWDAVHPVVLAIQVRQDHTAAKLVRHVIAPFSDHTCEYPGVRATRWR